MKLKDFYLIFGTICWLISLVSILFKYPKHLRLFSWFIFVSVAIEWIGWYIARHLHRNNLWLYNFNIIIEFLFLPFFYRLILRSHKIRQGIKLFLIIYPIIFFINLFFIQGLYVFNTYPYLIGDIFVLVLIINYFKEILLTPNNIKLHREPVFYISIAFLLFFTIEIPYTMLLPYFINHNLEVAMALIWVIKILNAVLYVLLSVAYLCQPRMRT